MKNYIKLFLPIIIVIVVLFAGCKQEINTPLEQSEDNSEGLILNSNESFKKKHDWLHWKTLFELLKARIATAKYHNINNAIKDGYVDINVVMPNMGYHYMKVEYRDGTFEIDKPEILVYSKSPYNGRMRLVAVEYAVPIDLSPDKAPEGFTGNYDVWNYNTDFGLWLLHAWVWHYNPEGVFNPTNPLVP